MKSAVLILLLVPYIDGTLYKAFSYIKNFQGVPYLQLMEQPAQQPPPAPQQPPSPPPQPQQQQPPPQQAPENSQGLLLASNSGSSETLMSSQRSAAAFTNEEPVQRIRPGSLLDIMQSSFDTNPSPAPFAGGQQMQQNSLLQQNDNQQAVPLPNNFNQLPQQQFPQQQVAQHQGYNYSPQQPQFDTSNLAQPQPQMQHQPSYQPLPQQQAFAAPLQPSLQPPVQQQPTFAPPPQTYLPPSQMPPTNLLASLPPIQPAPTYSPPSEPFNPPEPELPARTYLPPSVNLRYALEYCPQDEQEYEEKVKTVKVIQQQPQHFQPPAVPAPVYKTLRVITGGVHHEPVRPVQNFKTLRVITETGPRGVALTNQQPRILKIVRENGHHFARPGFARHPEFQQPVKTIRLVYAHRGHQNLHEPNPVRFVNVLKQDNQSHGEFTGYKY